MSENNWFLIKLRGKNEMREKNPFPKKDISFNFGHGNFINLDEFANFYKFLTLTVLNHFYSKREIKNPN